MSTIIASQVLANGLRTEFADTYSGVRNRLADSRLADVMDLGIGATNRQHEFAYFEAAPHMEYWRRGDPIPQDAMGSVQFTVPVYEWGRRVRWLKWDRKDDQISALMDSARQAGTSAALLPERFFFDILADTPSTLPAIPLAPDGGKMFATTVGGANRFGVSSGNLISGGGVATSAAILTDYYKALKQWMLFQDGKGQPLIMPELVANGAIIVHAAANLQAFETAFLQYRQGLVYGSNTAASTPSNIVLDASRNVTLWPTPRLSGNDWFVFMKTPPKKVAFLLDRQGLQEYTSLEGDNNSDHTRTTAEEYIQWELRQGPGVALPFGAIMIDN
jgi:hypothetical protein